MTLPTVLVPVRAPPQPLTSSSLGEPSSGFNEAMSDAAELSALAGSLDDLSRRLAAVAERHEQPPRDDVLGALYDAERSLRAARRRVEAAITYLR
jgi:hypothetical protein